MLFEFNSVSVYYNSGVPALRDINLNLATGSIYAIIGPTGAGKTTLLKLLYRDLKPTDGAVFFKSQDISTIRKKKLKLMRQITGVIFQEPKLLNLLTCFENIQIPLILNGIKKDRANYLLLEIMAELGINYLRSKMPDELSVGEKKLVNAARALVHNPEIIIADEVSENLDEKAKASVFNLFKAANKRGATIILTSADKQIINIFPDSYTINMKEGRLIE